MEEELPPDETPPTDEPTPPQAPAPHVPGTPANATTLRFDWSDPRNLRERERLAPVVELISKVRKLIATEVASDKDGSDLLSTVIARRLDLLEKLPPFPLAGANADLSLDDLRACLVVWGSMKAWMSTPREFTALGPPSADHPAGTPMPFTVAPLDLFRRVMTVNDVTAH
jgi:hypothetical protein